MHITASIDMIMTIIATTSSDGSKKRKIHASCFTFLCVCVCVYVCACVVLCMCMHFCACVLVFLRDWLRRIRQCDGSFTDKGPSGGCVLTSHCLTQFSLFTTTLSSYIERQTRSTMAVITSFMHSLAQVPLLPNLLFCLAQLVEHGVNTARVPRMDALTIFEYPPNGQYIIPLQPTTCASGTTICSFY